tara:strand:+ start:1764 stop:1937 length:174 start_codon:yes stop_codon:yes gene_type:complete
MKITNLSSRISKQQKFESGNINAIRQGIMERLLEKYKPKCLDDTNTMIGTKDKKRVA